MGFIYRKAMPSWPTIIIIASSPSSFVQKLCLLALLFNVSLQSFIFGQEQQEKKKEMHLQTKYGLIKAQPTLPSYSKKNMMSGVFIKSKSLFYYYIQFLQSNEKAINSKRLAISYLIAQKYCLNRNFIFLYFKLALKSQSMSSHHRVLPFLPQNLISFPPLIQHIIKAMKTTNFIALVLLLLNVVLGHNPHKPNPPLIPTFVTAWWPASGASDQLPTGQFLAAFEKLLMVDVNLIIFGDKALGVFIQKKRNKENTKFVEMDASAPTKSWHHQKVEQLKKSGQKLNAEDAVTPLLSYYRMFLLDLAVGQDAFNTDEFIWVDANALTSYQVEKIIQPKNIDTLLFAFKHHFFILTATKNSDVHAYPNIEKTYFENKFDTFVGGQLFGGKREAINTIFKIYEDLLKVVIQYDKNLWSEDALLSLLADRSPFLISYLSADDIKPPTGKRLLPEVQSENRFAEEKEELEYYEWLISLCEIGIVVMAILLGWQFVKFLKLTKKYNQRNLRADVNLEASSLNSMSQ